jgi:hypothetical protein
VSGVNGASNAEVRYASDPTGTWSSATIPAIPSGTTTVTPDSPYRMSFDGTYYAMCISYWTAFSTIKSRVIYATSLGGTWTAYEFDSGNTYVPHDFAYLNGEWVMAGYSLGSNPRPAFIGTCATPMGTWSFDTSSGGTGLDPSGLSSGDGWQIYRIGYADGDYVHLYDQITGSGVGLKTSTSLSSGWTDPTSAPAPSTYAYNVYFLTHANGHWMAQAILNADGKPYLAYASDPTGTWSTVTPTNLGLNATSRLVQGAAHDGTNYVLAGGESGTVYSSYLGSTGSPAGTYTTVTSGLAGDMTCDVVYHDPRHVTVQRTGAIRYSNSIPFPTPTPDGPTLLRQRQSPKRAPSRISTAVPDLRQRQTPRITG